MKPNEATEASGRSSDNDDSVPASDRVEPSLAPVDIRGTSLPAPTTTPATATTAAREPAGNRDYRFDKRISREVLENYLSRAITMEGLLNGRGDLADNARMLKRIGAKFIGRALCLWGGEAGILNNLDRAGSRSPRCSRPIRT